MEKIKHVIEISTDNSSMILAAGEQVYQCYYGKKVANPSQIVDGYTEMVPAYSAFGGDDSTAALRLTHANGDLSTELVYVKHAAERMDANITETTVELKDRCYPVYVTLHYRAYAAEDVIEKWISVRHTEAEAITLNEFPSAELSFSSLHNHYYLTTLNGLWEREHNLSEEQLQIGKKVLDNRYGTWSSFGSNPSFMLSLNEPATEDAGQVIAGALAWSGAWKISFDYHLGKLFHDNKERRVLSVVAGINDFAADYKLDPGQLFTTPTFMQSYSGNGKGELSRKIHRWARKYSLRDGDKERPILLNSWEGAYFTFGEETLLSMMDGLNKMDGEMFVLDDGWFGNKHPRNDAAAGLGDWQVNNKKLPNGITALCDAAEARNLKFGIWVEPEMVNPASELYENHPEWVIHQPNREKILYRNQLVLDLSNPEVQDFVYDSVAAILADSPKIAYVKWDCNRSFTNIGSSYLPADRQSHLWVDYTNGLYRIYDRLVENFPNVMIQACASGGGRIDYGILKRTQEFWTSDNTDALQRIFIQWGTGYMYPAIAMAAHVSACPNHQTGRVVPLKFRFDVAMSGRLGLELAPKEMSDDELAFVKAAVADYKRIRPTVQFGDLYRLISPYGSNFAALSYVSEDKTKAVAYAYTINHMLGNLLPQLTLKGLDPQKHYLITEINKSNGHAHITCDGKVLRGDVLMNHGLKVNLESEYDSAVFELTEKKIPFSRPIFSLVMLLMVLWVTLSADVLQAEQYDIVKAGTLTENARFAGVFHPQRDQKDDGTFTFGRLHNFLYAGAGFTSPDARIRAKLSLGNSNVHVPGQNYGAILSINNMGVSLEQDKEGRFYVGYGVKDFNGGNWSSTHSGQALPIVPAGTPFEMEVILADGDLTVNVNGKEACYIRKCPQLKHMQPKETVASHGLDLIVALRPWQEKEMKVYDFSVETKGKIVELPEIQEVFKGVRSFRREDLKEGTTHLYRIPALAVSKKGTLLAFAEARRDNASDHGNIDTVVKRSEDGGKTWSAEIIAADDGDNTMGNPCPVVDQDTGRIWLHLCWNADNAPENGLQPGFGKDSRRGFVTYSDDDGKTWATPKEVTQQVKKENWSWYATGPGGGIQLTRGKHKGRLIIPATHRAHSPKTGTSNHGFIVYSDDHGKTWNIGGPTVAGLNEAMAAELENGNVMLNCRLHGAGTSSQNHRGVSISGDGGKTFGRHYFDKTLLEPRCQGSLRRVRWVKDGKPGVIAFSNPAYPWRSHVMVRYSYDDGRTWPAGRIIYPPNSAYSDLAVLPDGRVAVMLEKDWWGSLGLAILPAPPSDPPAPEKNK